MLLSTGGLEDSGFPLEILPLSKVPELCAARDRSEGTLCSLCFSQISLRFLGHHPTSRRHLDAPAAGSWSCQGKSGESFASETEKSTPAALWSSKEGHEASHSISPTNIFHSRDEPQLQKLLLEKVASQAAAAPWHS